eukprot:SAG31_NODE_10113_length_1181_cov_1.119224_1_plen_91_part_00
MRTSSIGSYMAMDGFSLYSFLYFVVLISFGVFISINMFLAVISKAYEDEVAMNEEVEGKIEDAKAMLKLLTIEVNKALNRDLSAGADDNV